MNDGTGEYGRRILKRNHKDNSHANSAIIKRKVGLLNLAEEFGNVSKARKVLVEKI